ncbi:prepilin-type N-terminal cleavage/methylation domain-containing protein [Chromobacterium sphagni]|uniref:Type IV pilus modification protein PilV n=1 Tax=Chromobacterium sphagni TaxID=1903179 RepID=A0ABX3CGH6_9NEIS|nr:prepilin-type N-terminal cleavage/methylation domain-containing protein [Chromobacterium sphagni]OHX21276.1 hypothetical protein BI344_01675 [Chromobacterium sphagni]
MLAASPRQAGFSLLETMVALVIWMVALLALAGMQARSLQHARDAELRGRIDDAVGDLASAIQARPESHWLHYLESGYHDHLTAGDCAGQCSSAQLAAADLGRFKRALRSGSSRMEQVRAVVCRGDGRVMPSAASSGCGASGELAIRVAWRSRNGKEWQEHAGVWPLQP